MVLQFCNASSADSILGIQSTSQNDAYKALAKQAQGSTLEHIYIGLLQSTLANIDCASPPPGIMQRTRALARQEDVATANHDSTSAGELVHGDQTLRLHFRVPPLDHEMVTKNEYLGGGQGGDTSGGNTSGRMIPPYSIVLGEWCHAPVRMYLANEFGVWKICCTVVPFVCSIFILAFLLCCYFCTIIRFMRAMQYVVAA
jgi:hypothetical protein